MQKASVTDHSLAPVSNNVSQYDDYKRLFEFSSDLICIADFNGYFLDVNPQFSLTLGYSKEVLLSRPWIDFVHPDDVTATLEESKRLQVGGLPDISFTNRYKTFSGDYLPLRWKVVQDFSREKFYCIVKDVSQEIHIEKEYNSTREIFLQAQKTAQIGHWEICLADQKLIWSEETYRIHDVTPESFPDVSKCIEFYTQDSRERVTKEFLRCVNEGQSYDIHLELVTIKGNRRWVRSVGQPYYENGKITKVFGVFQDITYRYEVQQKLEISKNLADQAAREKANFLSNMSHEIRTPLHAMVGAADLLLDNYPRTDQMELLQIMKFSTKNLMALVNDILDYSKIESGKITLENFPTDIRHMLKTIELTHQITAREKGLKLRFHIDEKLPLSVSVDITRLTQVLNNLISNAVKFTERGKIDVTIRAEKLLNAKVHIDFSIKDTGIGIPEHMQNQVFNSFTQAQSDTTRKYGGTGLGLTISKNIVNLMGGELRLKSRERVGSEFYFSLILDSNKVEKKETTDHPQVKMGSLNGRHILLVEDTPFNIRIATRFLEKWGAKVSLAKNGQIAVDKAAQNQYDLILMDLQMPVMGGKEATSRIREFDKQTPIVAITAAAPFQKLGGLKELGMNDLVPKPFEPDNFYGVLIKNLRL